MAPFRAGFETRIIVEVVISLAAWTGVIALGLSGAIPLWLGLVLNTVVASTLETGPILTPKGVRTEGRALGATGPIVW